MKKLYTVSQNKIKANCGSDHELLIAKALFSFWLHFFILSGVISPLFSRAYWAPTNLGSSSFSALSFCPFILFMGFSRQEY